MRVISNDALAALDSGRFRVRCLLRAEMDEGDFSIWDDYGSITVAGVTYSGAPGRFTVSPVSSVSDMSARNCDVSLSALDLETIGKIDEIDWHQRPITIQRAILAEDAPQTIHVMTYFSGFLDQMIWKETPGGTANITFRCEPSARELQRKGTRTRSDSDQRERDSEDGFFASVVQASSTNILWGRRNPPRQADVRKRFLSFFK